MRPPNIDVPFQERSRLGPFLRDFLDYFPPATSISSPLIYRESFDARNTAGGQRHRVRRSLEQPPRRISSPFVYTSSVILLFACRKSSRPVLTLFSVAFQQSAEGANSIFVRPYLMTTSARVDPRRCGSSDVPSHPQASP